MDLNMSSANGCHFVSASMYRSVGFAVTLHSGTYEQDVQPLGITTSCSHYDNNNNIVAVLIQETHEHWALYMSYDCIMKCIFVWTQVVNKLLLLLMHRSQARDRNATILCFAKYTILCLRHAMLYNANSCCLDLSVSSIIIDNAAHDISIYNIGNRSPRCRAYWFKSNWLFYMPLGLNALPKTNGWLRSSLNLIIIYIYIYKVQTQIIYAIMVSWM